MGNLCILDCAGPPFLRAAAPVNLAGHSKAEAYSYVPSRTLTGRLPQPRQEGSGRYPSQLREGNISVSVIMSCKDAACERVSNAWPHSLLAGVEVAIVFMQHAAKAKRHRALDRVLAFDIRKPFAVAGCSLFPFRGFVLPLVDSCRESGQRLEGIGPKSALR